MIRALSLAVFHAPRLARAFALLVAFAAMLLMTPQMVEAESRDIVIDHIEGQVQIQRQPLGQPDSVRAARRGEAVQAGETVITAHDGRVQMRFSDGGVISLQGDTQFRIDDYEWDESTRQRSFLSLLKGTMKQVSGRIGKRSPDDYRLTTPTATIGIRGTVFTVEQVVCDPVCPAGRKAGMKVQVGSGKVAVRNRAGEVLVPAGRSVELRDENQMPELSAQAQPSRTVQQRRPAAAPANAVEPAQQEDGHLLRWKYEESGDSGWKPVAAPATTGYIRNTILEPRARPDRG